MPVLGLGVGELSDAETETGRVGRAGGRLSD